MKRIEMTKNEVVVRFKKEREIFWCNILTFLPNSTWKFPQIFISKSPQPAAVSHLLINFSHNVIYSIFFLIFKLLRREILITLNNVQEYLIKFWKINQEKEEFSLYILRGTNLMHSQLKDLCQSFCSPFRLCCFIKNHKKILKAEICNKT